MKISSIFCLSQSISTLSFGYVLVMKKMASKDLPFTNFHYQHKSSAVQNFDLFVGLPLLTPANLN